MHQGVESALGAAFRSLNTIRLGRTRRPKVALMNVRSIPRGLVISRLPTASKSVKRPARSHQIGGNDRDEEMKKRIVSPGRGQKHPVGDPIGLALARGSGIGQREALAFRPESAVRAVPRYSKLPAPTRYPPSRNRSQTNGGRIIGPCLTRPSTVVPETSI